MGDILQLILLGLSAFLVVLTVVVVVHEYGHFQAGRWCKAAIRSFSLGWGAPLVSRVDRHGTTWKISQIPIGGFVSFMDDGDPSGATMSAEAAQVSPEEARRRGYLRTKSVAQRAFVSVAGPTANLIFSIVVFAILAMILGRDVTPTTSLSARVDGIVAGGPAALAGLKPGDVVTSINGHAVASFGEMQTQVRGHAGTVAQFVVTRDGAAVTLPVRIGGNTDRTGIKEGFLGVTRESLPSERRIVHPGPIQALGFGAADVWSLVARTGSYLGAVVTGQATPAQFSGPIGIFSASSAVAKGAVAGSGDVADKLARLALSLAGLTAVLSVAVGLANLLPLPVLDGGQLLLLGVEAVRGRPLGPKAQEISFNAGVALVASLILLATWNDLQRLKLLEFLGGMLS